MMTDESRRDFLVEPYSPQQIAEAVINIRTNLLSTDFYVDLDIDGITKKLLVWLKSRDCFFA